MESKVRVGTPLGNIQKGCLTSEQRDGSVGPAAGPDWLSVSRGFLISLSLFSLSPLPLFTPSMHPILMFSLITHGNFPY